MQEIENEEPIIKPAKIMPRCEELLDEALAYIEENSHEQAEIMSQQFFKTVRLLEKMPGIGTIYEKGMRKTGLGKFRRYNIYYREKEKTVEILGIWHTSRGTKFEDEC